MTDAHMLDHTIHKASFWSPVVLILAGVLLLVPLISMTVYFGKKMKGAPYA